MPIPGDKIRFYVLRTLSGGYAIQEKTVAQMQEAMKEDPTLASRLENRLTKPAKRQRRGGPSFRVLSDLPILGGQALHPVAFDN